MMVESIPLWLILLFLPIIYWPVTLVLAIVCWVGGKLLRGVGRWVCWSLGGVLTLYLLFGLVMVASDPVSDWWTKMRLKAISGTLREPRAVAGVTLPAGTKVHWSRTDKSDFDEANLPSTALIMGVKVKGAVSHDLSRFEMTLAEPQQIEGWACAADEVADRERWQAAVLRAGQRCGLAWADDPCRLGLQAGSRCAPGDAGWARDAGAGQSVGAAGG